MSGRNECESLVWLCVVRWTSMIGGIVETVCHIVARVQEWMRKINDVMGLDVRKDYI